MKIYFNNSLRDDLSLPTTGGANLVVGAIALHLLRIGYKIRG